MRGLAIAREAGVTTVLNPAPAAPVPERMLGLCDYVTPNETEASAMTGLPVGSEDEARAAARALRERGASAVVITLGAEGALFDGPGGGHLVPAFRAGPVVETTGAGDAFNGAFAVALAEGRGAGPGGALRMRSCRPLGHPAGNSAFHAASCRSGSTAGRGVTVPMQGWARRFGRSTWNCAAKSPRTGGRSHSPQWAVLLYLISKLASSRVASSIGRNVSVTDPASTEQAQCHAAPVRPAGPDARPARRSRRLRAFRRSDRIRHRRRHPSDARHAPVRRYRHARHGSFVRKRAPPRDLWREPCRSVRRSVCSRHLEGRAAPALRRVALRLAPSTAQ